VWIKKVGGAGRCNFPTNKAKLPEKIPTVGGKYQTEEMMGILIFKFCIFNKIF